MRRASLLLLLALVLPPSALADGRQLYMEGCASCHGMDARGVPGQGPDLHGAGAAAADFYLSTGRMPLAEPTDQPTRSDPAYSRSDIDQLAAYIGSLGGPPIPDVDPAQGSERVGLELFAENCAGCHHMTGAGGIVTSAVAPSLSHATPRQVAEAVRRRRIESSPDDVFVSKLLGLSLTRQQVDRGRAFVTGVVERAGDEGLRQLFDSADSIPTPNEVDAPGLWLARLEL